MRGQGTRATRAEAASTKDASRRPTGVDARAFLLRLAPFDGSHPTHCSDCRKLHAAGRMLERRPARASTADSRPASHGPTTASEREGERLQDAVQCGNEVLRMAQDRIESPRARSIEGDHRSCKRGAPPSPGPLLRLLLPIPCEDGSSTNGQPRKVRHLEQVELAPAAKDCLDDLAPREAVEVLLLEVAVQQRRAHVAQVPQPVGGAAHQQGGARGQERGVNKKRTHLTPLS